MGKDHSKPKRSFISKFFGIIGKLFLGLVLLLFLLVAILAFSIKTEKLQRLLVQTINTEASEALGTEVRLSEIGLSLPFQIRLSKLSVKDEAGDLLFACREVRVSPSLLPLLRKHIQLREVVLDGPEGYIHNLVEDEMFNYEFLIEQLVSDQEKPPSDEPPAWTFELKRVKILSLSLNYQDHYHQQFLKAGWDQLDVEWERFDLDKGEMLFKRVLLDRPAIQLTLPKAVATVEADSSELNTFEGIDLANTSGMALALKNLQINDLSFEFLQSNVLDTLGPESIVSLHDFYLNLKDVSWGEKESGLHLAELSFQEKVYDVHWKSLDLKAHWDEGKALASLDQFSFGEKSRFSGPLTIEWENLAQNFEGYQLAFSNNTFFLSGKDVASFLPSFESELIASPPLELQWGGKLNSSQLQLDRFEARVGPSLKINLNGLIEEWMDLPSIQYELSLNHLEVQSRALGPWQKLLGLDAELVRALSYVSSKMKVKGDYRQGRLNGYVQSAPGRLDVQAQFGQSLFAGQSNSSEEIWGFKGKVFSKELKWNSAWLSDSDLPDFSGAFDLQTEGYWNESLTFFQVDSMELDIPYFAWDTVRFENIRLAASFKDSLVHAGMVSHNEGLDFDFTLYSELHRGNEYLSLSANVNDFLLHLWLPDTTYQSVRAKVLTEVTGFDLEQMKFSALLTDLFYENRQGVFEEDRIEVSYEAEGLSKNLLVDSDFLKCQGNLELSIDSLPAAIAIWKNEVKSWGQAAHKEDWKNFRASLQIQLKYLPSWVQMLVPELGLPQGARMDLFAFGVGDSLSLDLDVPVVSYDEGTLKQVRLYALGQLDSLNSRFQWSSGSWGKDINIPLLDIIARINPGMAQINTQIGEEGEDIQINMDKEIRVQGDTLHLLFAENDFRLLEGHYQIDPGSSVFLTDSLWWINHFAFGRENEKIQLESIWENGLVALKGSIYGVEPGPYLQAFQLIDFALDGKMEAEFLVLEPEKLSRIDLNMSLNELRLENQGVGNVSLQASKKADQEEITAAILLKGAGNDLKLDGFYSLDSTAYPQYSLDLDVTRLDLEPWAVLLEEFTESLSGRLEGKALIQGLKEGPQIEGHLALHETMAQPKAIGSMLFIEKASLEFSKDKIQFQDWLVKDSRDNSIIISGLLKHQNFNNFVTDLSVDTKNFTFYEKTPRQDPNLNGIIMGLAKLQLKGPVENLVLSGQVNTNRGTSLVFSLMDEEAGVAFYDFIDFEEIAKIQEGDTLSIPADMDFSSRQDLSGFAMDLKVGVSPDTRIKIVIDPKAGDNITAVGEGDFRFRMTPSGDMNLQGTYTLSDGNYTLSFMDVVRKSFKIRKGSTLTWVGDPLDAIFDITAVYTTEASRYELIQDEASNLSANEVALSRRRLPVNVVLKIKGTLDYPELSFDIEIPESEGGNANQVVQRLNRIKQNETELIKQVFGLVVLNRFIPDSGGTSNQEGGLTYAVNERFDASVSQLLTSQLNRVTNEYLGGVEMEVKLDTRQNPGMQDANDKELGFQFSKRLFDDRLQVKVGGTTDVHTAGQSDSFNNIMGDFEVLYRLNANGTLSVKIFQRDRRNLFSNDINQEAGVSLSHQKSFDHVLRGRSN